MPFQCKSHNIGWIFDSTTLPRRTYAVIFFKYTDKDDWNVRITDLTSNQDIDTIKSKKEPTQERAELILRCYVENDRDFEAYIQRHAGN